VFSLGRLTLVIAFIAFVAAPALPRAEEPKTICKGSLLCLDQGWTDEQRDWWYTTSQGSRLIPLNWMLALESASASDGRTEAFLSDRNLQLLGYLGAPASKNNPFGLPLGFTVDEEPSDVANVMCDTFPQACKGGLMQQKWVGMTCAACHTNDIEYGNKRVRVEGAPTLADFQGFGEAFLAALRATSDDAAKFDRFARAVLQGGFSEQAVGLLKSQLAEQIAWQQKLHDINRSDVRYGHGRLDAQGHILNKVVLTIRGVSEQIQDVKADAPASYPFIWNTAQQKRLQWNGIADNKTDTKLVPGNSDGPLVRNTAEVIGVFAHIETHDQSVLQQGYKSSLRLGAMNMLEQQLATLKSPRWPEDVLGPIDQAKAERGETHFKNMGCSGCHKPLAWDDLTSPANEVMVPIQDQKTDIFLACNTFLHRSKAGHFTSQPYAIDENTNQVLVLLEVDATRHMLANTAFGAIIHQHLASRDAPRASNVFRPGNANRSVSPAAEYLPEVSNKQKKAQAELCDGSKDPILAYKARPLNGIWATAPYLHNGSVPTLYDLLLPETVQNVGTANIAPAPGASRPEIFGVGSREFDPRKVGFVTDIAKNPTTFRVRDEKTGEPIPGNYNSGHAYGTRQLTDEQRWELVEYLKKL
jgi:hypothetical protein